MDLQSELIHGTWSQALGTKQDLKISPGFFHFYPSVHHDEDGQGVSPEQEGGEGRGPGQAGPQLTVGHPQREEVQRGLLPRQPPVRDMQALLRTYLE